MEENNKTCETCISFFQHYAYYGDRFRRIKGVGHCLNTKENGRYRKTDRPCECYIEKDIKEEKQQQVIDITNRLEIMSNQLNEIQSLLKD